MDDPPASLSAWHQRCRGLRLRAVTSALVDIPGAQLRCGRPLVRRGCGRRLCLRPGFGKSHEGCRFGHGGSVVDRFPWPLLGTKQEARAHPGADLTARPEMLSAHAEA